jgi:hypothetical protein
MEQLSSKFWEQVKFSFSKVEVSPFLIKDHAMKTYGGVKI